MWVVDISSDMIRLFVEGNEKSFPRNGVETLFGPYIVELYRKHPTNQILLINGPGGFTNLRVGSLALNVLNTLNKAKILFFSWTKLELYTYLVGRGVLPGQGAIYLGQKHNVWWYDFTQMCSTQLCLESLPVEENVPYFVDFVSDPQYWEHHAAYMISRSVSSDGLLVEFCGNTFNIPFADIMNISSPVVVPQYFIEAI